VSDLLRTGSAWLEAKRKAHMSRAVVYVRGSSEIALSATVGRTEFENVDEYGIVRRSESRDFLITADDLVDGETRFEPAAGDRIREQFGEFWRIYEVGAPQGTPPFRSSDPDRVTLRVHTNFVGEEPIE
jgi:hypothetical protein